MSQKVKIYNGKIITPYRIIPSGSILISGESIVAISESNIEVADAIEIDARGKYISPGFIDIHIHGGGELILWMAAKLLFPKSLLHICNMEQLPWFQPH